VRYEYASVVGDEEPFQREFALRKDPLPGLGVATECNLSLRLQHILCNSDVGPLRRPKDLRIQGQVRHAKSRPCPERDVRDEANLPACLAALVRRIATA
jgi:hypothetical protein